MIYPFSGNANVDKADCGDGEGWEERGGGGVGMQNCGGSSVVG